MRREKIDCFFIREIELEHLKESAELYYKIYYEDDDLRELTDSAMTGWPERKN